MDNFKNDGAIAGHNVSSKYATEKGPEEKRPVSRLLDYSTRIEEYTGLCIEKIITTQKMLRPIIGEEEPPNPEEKAREILRNTDLDSFEHCLVSLDSLNKQITILQERIKNNLYD